MILSRLEEGCENTFLKRGSRWFDAYPRIHDLATLPLRQRDDRIQVEFADFRNRFGEVGHAQQHFSHRPPSTREFEQVSGSR
jgi:hypothetical protein